MSTGNLFLVFFACVAGGCTCYPVADSSEELLGQLKVSTHVVREVSLSWSFRKSNANKSLIFATIQQINQLNQMYQQLNDEPLENSRTSSLALKTVLWEMLIDGCNWAKHMLEDDSINCTIPTDALQEINQIVNVYQTADRLYDTLANFKPEPTEDYESWVKNRIFCNECVSDNVTGFVLENHTPFLTLRRKSKTDVCGYA